MPPSHNFTFATLEPDGSLLVEGESTEANDATLIHVTLVRQDTGFVLSAFTPNPKGTVWTVKFTQTPSPPFMTAEKVHLVGTAVRPEPQSGPRREPFVWDQSKTIES